MVRLLVIVLLMAGAPLTLSSVRPDAAGPSLHEEFATLSTADWDVYDSPGNAGQGLRRPSQVVVGGGVVTIYGTADGTTGGMKWRNRSQTYGQWDIRMRTWRGCVCYHPVVLLWGSGGGSGVDNPLGEIDIIEVWQRANRDRNSFSVHYGDGSQFVGGDTAVDMTQWHVYHVVWQDQYIYTWIDDNPAYFSTDDVGVIPHGPMDLTIQLDWFPQEGSGGTGKMQVDYVTQYPQPVNY
jgi:hypothetical protein